MELNLSQMARPTLKVTLPDERETVVHVLSPLKYQAERALQSFADILRGETTPARVTAFALELISNNAEGVKFDAKYAKKYLTDSDISVFFESYSAFVLEIENQKN